MVILGGGVLGVLLGAVLLTGLVGGVLLGGGGLLVGGFIDLIGPGGLVGDTGFAHPVGSGRGGRLEGHPAVLGAEPDFGPGVGVSGGHRPFVAVQLPGGEADGHAGGIALGGHHQREGGGELLAVADPVLEEGFHGVLPGRGAHGQGVGEGVAEEALEGDRGVEGGVGVGVLGDLGGQVGGDLGDLVAVGVADVEGFLEHGRVHPAQTVSGGRAGLGLHLVAQAGDVRAVASQRQLPVGGQGADACIDLLGTDLQRAQVVRDGQAVASEAGDPHVVLDQLVGGAGHGRPVGAGIGEGGRGQIDGGASAGGLGGLVGLAVEHGQGAQPQVGGLGIGGGVAQHLRVVLLEQGTAHGDVVVDHHRPQLGHVPALPLVEQVDVQRDSRGGELWEHLADGHREGRHEQAGDAGRGGGADRGGQRTGLRSAVPLEQGGVGVDGAGGEDQQARQDRCRDGPPGTSGGLLQCGHQQGGGQQQPGGGVPAQVDEHQVQREGDQGDQHDHHDRAAGPDHHGGQPGGELVDGGGEDLRLGADDPDRAGVQTHQILGQLDHQHDQGDHDHLQQRHHGCGSDHAAQHGPGDEHRQGRGGGQKEPGGAGQQARQRR